MAGFICPHCGSVMALNNETHRTRFTAFENSDGRVTTSNGQHYFESSLELEFYNCPNCTKVTLFAKGIGNKVKAVDTILFPSSLARQYPEFVPQQIRNDYEEACAILSRSPKASATLSRRCLQGMIRDFWGITKSRLYDEISALKDKIQPDLWLAIDSLRQLGNIGAHMEKDVDLIVDIDPGEAEKLIKLIELLIKEWYINREERRQLFGDILQINADKQATRKGEG